MRLHERRKKGTKIECGCRFRTIAVPRPPPPADAAIVPPRAGILQGMCRSLSSLSSLYFCAVSLLASDSSYSPHSNIAHCLLASLPPFPISRCINITDFLYSVPFLSDPAFPPDPAKLLAADLTSPRLGCARISSPSLG